MLCRVVCRVIIAAASSPPGAARVGAPGEPRVAGELLEPVGRGVQPGTERAEPPGVARHVAVDAVERPGRAAAAPRPSTSAGPLPTANAPRPPARRRPSRPSPGWVSARTAGPTGVSSRDIGRLTNVATKPSSDLVARANRTACTAPASIASSSACSAAPPASAVVAPTPGVEAHRARRGRRTRTRPEQQVSRGRRRPSRAPGRGRPAALRRPRRPPGRRPRPAGRRRRRRPDPSPGGPASRRRRPGRPAPAGRPAPRRCG